MELNQPIRVDLRVAPIETLIKGVLYLVGYLVAVFAGSPLVNAVLSKLELTKEQKETLSGIKGAGKIIGMLERVITTTFMYLNVPTAIAIIFAAKSIIRFESAKERHFAEYYLIGTLTSITFAVITAAFFAYLVTLLP